MPFARCSDLDRLLSCPGDAVLQGSYERPETTKIAADWGTMVHQWKQTGEVVAVNKRENLVPLFRKKLIISGVKREQWWPEDAVHETAVALSPWDGLTGSVNLKDHGTAAEKDAWKAGWNDYWLTGTADTRWMMFDTLTVEDLKTGRWVSWEDYQYQVTGYVLGISKALGYRGPVNAFLTHWPRYPVTSQPNRFGKVIEQDELAAFEKRLVKLRSDILRAREKPETLNLVTGEQCVYCNSRGICPALRKPTEEREDGISD